MADPEYANKLIAATLEQFSLETVHDVFGGTPLLDWMRQNQAPVKPLTRHQRIRQYVAGRFWDWHERLRVAGNALRGHYDYEED